MNMHFFAQGLSMETKKHVAKVPLFDIFQNTFYARKVSKALCGNLLNVSQVAQSIFWKCCFPSSVVLQMNRECLILLGKLSTSIVKFKLKKSCLIRLSLFVIIKMLEIGDPNHCFQNTSSLDKLKEISSTLRCSSKQQATVIVNSKNMILRCSDLGPMVIVRPLAVRHLNGGGVVEATPQFPVQAWWWLQWQFL